MELNRYKKSYKKAVLEVKEESIGYITSGENDKEIVARLRAIVAAEEPISYDFLLKRCLTSLGIFKFGAKVEARMEALVSLCGFKSEKICGMRYYRKSDKPIPFDRYRVETGEVLRKDAYDFAPQDIVTLIKGSLEDKVALYMDEIQTIVTSVLHIPKTNEKFSKYVNDCVTYGEEQGLFIRSISDRISLA